MQTQDAVNSLRGIRRELSRNLSREGARAVGVQMLDQAVRGYGSPEVYAAYAEAVGIAMNRGTRSGFRRQFSAAKQRLKGRLRPSVEGSYHYHLFNALCGLENLYGKGGNYKFGLSLILRHVSGMDQDCVSSLAEQISWISQALEADETRVLMENLSATRGLAGVA